MISKNTLKSAKYLSLVIWLW